MSDLFDEFVFDLQRFDNTKAYGDIQGFSTATEAGNNYWKEDHNNFWLYDVDADGKPTQATKDQIRYSLSGTTLYVDEINRIIPVTSTTALYVGNASLSSSVTTLGGDSYISFTTGGKMYFGVSGAELQEIHFVNADDALVLNEKGKETFGNVENIYFQNESLSETFPTFDLTEVQASTNKKLALTSETGDFKLSGLSAGDSFDLIADEDGDSTEVDIAFGASDAEKLSTEEVPAYLKNASVGGYVEFNLAKEINISVGTGGVVLVAQGADSLGVKAATGGITVNGMAGFEKIGTTGFAYDNNVNGEGNQIVYFTDVNFEGGGSTTEELEGTVRNISINGINASVKGLSEDYSGLILDQDGNLAGFTFAAGDSDATLILKGADLSNFKLYNGYNPDEADDEKKADQLIGNIPTVTGSDITAIQKSTDKTTKEVSFGLVVNESAIATDGTANITVNGAGGSFVSILFDENGIKGFMPAANPSLSSADDPTDFAKGLEIVVNDTVSTYDGLNGLLFGGQSSSNYVAVGSGKYTYSIGSDSKVAIALNNSADTVFALASADKLQIASGSGTITDATDNDGNAENDATYKYTNKSGNAYFYLAQSGSAVAITVGTDSVHKTPVTLPEGIVSQIDGFVFMGEGDALNISGNSSIAIMYENESASAVEVTITPTVSADSYTVEMTAPYGTPVNGGASVAEFAVNNFSASNTEVQFGGGSFVFGTKTDEFLFNSAGGAVGFSAADTVSMNQGAADFLAGGSFFINGESVDIVANLEGKQLVFDANDGGESSLFGLSSGSEIANAGNITKIYGASGTIDDGNNFVIGGKSYFYAAQGTSAADRAFFTVDGISATGFTFMQEGDALKVTSTMPDLTLTDNDTSNDIDAPTAYDDKNKTDKLDAYIIAKGEGTNYEMSGFSTGNYVEIETAASDNASVTFETLAGDSAAIVYDMYSKALVGFDELTDGDAIKVAGVSNAVDFDGATVQVAGDNVSYIYTYGSESAALDDVYANVTIKQLGGASYVGTASGVNGIGIYEFAAGASTQTFGVSNYQYDATKVDGVNFLIGTASNVTAIEELNDSEFVYGDEASFAGISKVNDEQFAVSGASWIAVQGNADATAAKGIYLDDGEDVVVTATAGASGVMVSDISKIAFGSGSAFTIAGEDAAKGTDSVESTLIQFNLNGLSVVGISAVGSNESITGYFGSVSSVNGVSFDVTDANEIMIVGDDDGEGITKIGKVSGGASIANVAGASIVETDTEGEFTFADNGSPFTVSGDTSVVFQMSSVGAAQVEGVNDFGNAGTSATLAGMLQGLTINNSSASIVIEGDTDSIFSYMVDANGENATLGNVGGASIVYINETAGASFVQTDAVGTFVFASGQSFTTDDDSLTFKVDADGVVTEIYGLNKDKQVTGNFDSLVSVYGESSLQGVQVNNDKDVQVYYDELLLKDISDLATIQRADGIVEAWTDSIAAGSSIQVTDGDGHTFVVAASASDSDGVMFALDGEDPAHILGVSSLAQSATLGGDLGVLTAINGQSFGVTETAVESLGGDGQFSVVGAEGGIGEIVGLGGSVAINDAGSAVLATTNDDALITFADGNEFYVGGISDAKPEVSFVMDESNAVAITDINDNEVVVGSGSAFEALETVNTQNFDVKGASYVGVIGTADASKLSEIAVMGGSVAVNAAAGASFVTTYQVNQISFGGASAFTLEGGQSNDIIFAIDDKLAVNSISDVEAVESITGDFNDVEAVNGQSFVVVDPDKEIMVVGNDDVKGISKIALVSDSAVINDVGGASQVITDTEGEFNFVGHNDAFSVVGDNSVTFNMSASAPAIVKGITDFAQSGESFAMVVGDLNGISINDKGTIDVDGDADDILAYTKETYEGEDFYGLAVAGSSVTINGAASATFIEAGSDGKYTFAMDKADDPTTYTVGGDSEIVFEVDGNKVVGIYDMEKDASVTGDFSNVVSVEGIAADGTVEEEGTVQILNDSIVTVVYDDFEVKGLNDGASITSFTDFKHAYTEGVADDETLAVYDADGDQFVIAGDSDGVHYLLDGTGNIVGVSGLDAGAVLSGNLGALSSVNGVSFDVKETAQSYGGDGVYSVVGANDGIAAIGGLGGSVAINDAASAFVAVTNDDALITFKDGGQFYVGGSGSEKPEVAFFMNDGNAFAVAGISRNELVMGSGSAFENLIAVNTQKFDVKGASALAVVGNQANDGLTGIAVFGGSNVVVSAAASAIFVDAANVDQITFGESSTFQIDGESKAVSFIIDEQLNVGSVNNVNAQESVTGNFNDIASVNGADFDVTDSNEIMVVGNEKVDGLTKIANVSDSAVIANVAGASQVITDESGTFTFTNSNQVFEIYDLDQSATFDMNGNDVANVNIDFGVVISDNSNFANVSVNGALVDIKGDEGDMAIGALSSDGIDLVANLGSASGVTVNNAGGASYIAADKEGNFTFTKDGRAFNVAGDSQAVFVLDENENVTAIGKADKGASIVSDFSKAVAFAGFSVPGSRGGFGDVTATVQIANDPDVMVVHDGFEVHMLSDGASISSATTVEKAYTDGAASAALTVIDASGDEFTVFGDADGVMYSLNGSGEIIAVDGLDEGAILGGNLSELKAINGKDFDITETAVDGLGGNGVYSVVGGASAVGIGKVVGLGGLVFVNNAGGASELVTDDNIVIRGGNSFAKRIHISNDSDKTVTFGVSGTNDIVSVSDFAGTSSAVAIIDANLDGINGLTINDKGAVSVVGDGNDKVIFKDDGTGNATLTGIDNLNSSEGATIYSSAYADKIKTSGDGIYNFYDKQEFIVMGEGDGGSRSADSLKNAVWYDVDNDSVTAISSLNGSIAGDFTNAINVNGEDIQVLGDSGVIVVGTGSIDSAAANVSALEAVNSGATVVAWGSASHVGVVSDNGTLSNYQFIGADKQAQNYIAADTTDSIFSFSTDKDKVTGVEDLIDGYISFNPNETGSASLNVNVAQIENQTMTFASTENVSLTVDPYEVVIVEGVTGSVSGVVGKETPATVIGVDGITSINVNGKDIYVDDDDDQFNVVVHDTTPDYVYDVDGDSTVLADSVSVRANSAGTDTNPTKDTYVIGGESYIFDDSKDENDGFTFVTDSNGVMNKVASLEGALVINDGEWKGNINGDDFEVIDYPNDVNPPVTVNSGVSGIESVGGLDHKDSVNGDLGAAQVHIPGYGEEGGHYPGTTITINGKPYTVVTDPDGVDVTGDDADVITDLDKEASLIGAEGEVTVNGTELEPEDGDVIKGDRDDNSHARIVGDDELIRQATAINHYNHRGYDVDTEETTAAAFNIEDVVGLPTYTGAPFYYLDRDSSDYAQLVAGTSLAVIDFNQPYIFSLENVDSLTGEVAYKTEQVFDMSSYSYTKKVYMNGEGPQAVKFNNEGGNLAIVAAGSTGVKNVSLGSGGDAVVMDEDYALQNAVYIYGGVGDDSVFVRHNANTYIDFSAGGEDILVTAGEANARVTIAGYQASTGAAIRVEEYLDVENETAGTIAEGIENGIISFAEGTVIITSDEGRSEVYVGTNGYGGQIVNLMTHVTSGNDSLQAVGFTGSDGGVVDGSSFQSPLIMIGNSDNSKTAGSSLVGGLANDTFYGGADDTIEVGYGNDYVSLFNDSLRSGAYVNIGYGRTTIEGANNTLADSTGDVISVAIDPNDATFSLLYNDSLGTLELESSADGYYALLTDVDTLEGNYTTQYIYDEIGEELYSVAIGTVNSTIKVTEDEDLRPNVFFGYQTAIDFRDYTGDAIIDLRGDMAESIIDETIVIIDDDITTLYAGIGDTALKGDLDDETFYAGKGNTWLYGDGGKNLLVGYDNTNNDKEGQTVFYVLGNEDGAAHTISGFNYVQDDNYYTDTRKVTADALEFDLDDNNITRIDISGNDLVIEITDKLGNDTESALLKDAIKADGTGRDFIVSDNVAQVAENTLVFDQFADYYYATGKNATVQVSGRIEDDVVLWLDEDETGKVFEGDIHVIDATQSDATAQLAGNENDNVIYAGTGETSLWGGEGGNDLLVGNAGGRDTFYYSFGNGDDTITNVKDGDVIALDVSLDQIDEIDMSDASAIRIIMNDGDVLTINDAGHDLNVMIDNGEDGTDTYSTREARSRQ